MHTHNKSASSVHKEKFNSITKVRVGNAASRRRRVNAAIDGRRMNGATSVNKGIKLSRARIEEAENALRRRSVLTNCMAIANLM